MLDTATYTPRLQAEYREKIRAALKEEFGYKNDMMIPKLDKIVLNIGCGAEGDRMYEFLDRLITIAMPRIRDFRGVPGKSFDGRGNYAMGLKEHIVFPEIDFDKVDETWGMDIVIATTAKTDAEAKALLKAFNMPFNS